MKKITTKEEYEAAVLRIEKAQEALKGLWESADATHVTWIRAYQELEAAVLDYEIENNIIPALEGSK